MKTTLVARNAHALRLLILAIAAPWALGCVLLLACASARAVTVYTIDAAKHYDGPHAPEHWTGTLTLDGDRFEADTSGGYFTGAVDSFAGHSADNPCIVFGFGGGMAWIANMADSTEWGAYGALVAAVPEGETWALMLAGFALAALRKVRAAWRWYVAATRTPATQESLEW